MCPIVPTFTCGLDRSNFSFAMAFPPPTDMDESQSRLRSITGVEPKELLADLGGDALHLAQVMFANLAAVGIAESGITFLRLGAEEAVSQDGFKLADAELCATDALQENSRLGRGESLIDGVANACDGHC